MSALILKAPEEMTVLRVRRFAPDFLAAARRGGRISVDLSAVSRIDTAGLQLLLAVRREAKLAKTQFEFINPTEVVSETLGFCQLGELLVAAAEQT